MDPDLRKQVDLLKQRHSSRVLVLNLPLPQSQPGKLREASLIALRELKDPAAIEPLLDLLRRGAFLSTGLGYPVGEVLREYQDPRLTDVVVSLLNDKNAAERAVQALGKMGDSRAAGPLRQLLFNPKKNVAVAAAEALGSLEDRESVELLLSLLRDNNANLRKAAVTSLGQIRDVSAVDWLIYTLQDKSLEVKVAAIKALGAIGDDRAFEPLAKELTNSSVVCGAALAIDKLGLGSRIWPMLHEVEQIIGEPVVAAGVFERDVKLGLGGMTAELGLGCLVTLAFAIPFTVMAALLGQVSMAPFILVVALTFGFAAAHMWIARHKSRREGLPIRLVLAATPEVLFALEWEPGEKGAKLKSKVLEWRRAALKASIARDAVGMIQKLIIIEGDNTFNFVPKEDPRSPCAYRKLIEVVAGEE